MSSHLFRPQLDPSTRLCLGEACFSGEVGNSGTQTFGGELPEILGANGCCFKEGLTHTPSLQKKIMSSLGYHLGTVFRYRDTSAWQARRSVWDEVWIQSFQGHGNCVYQVFLRSHKATTLSSWAQAKDAKATPLKRTVDFLRSSIMPLSSSRLQRTTGEGMRFGEVWRDLKFFKAVRWL